MICKFLSESFNPMDLGTQLLSPTIVSSVPGRSNTVADTPFLLTWTQGYNIADCLVAWNSRAKRSVYQIMKSNADRRMTYKLLPIAPA